MRILQVIPYFVPAWDFGGPVRVCYELSKQLVRRGHDVTVYSTDALNAGGRVRTSEETIDGIKVKRFRNLTNSIAYQHKVFLSPGMSLLAADLKTFDVIHMHEYSTLQNVQIYYQAKRLKIPYVLQAHGSIPIGGTKRNLKRLFNRLWGYSLLRGAARLIALTRTEAKYYQDMGARQDKIQIIPNGIDFSEVELPPFGTFRRKYALDSKCRIVLYVGRIHETKGLDLLVRAFAGSLSKAGDTGLVIVGPDDGYLHELKRLTRDLDISERVLFTGPLYGKEKWGAYVDADVFVTPSFSGFPMTFLEASICGLPIVTTEKGDKLEWIDCQAGYVTSYDEKRVGDAIMKILSDHDMAKKFGIEGKRVVRERFNWLTITEQLERTYCGCLN